jgi:hypothetical protein
VTSVENTEKCFKTLTSRTKDGEERESESEIKIHRLEVGWTSIDCKIYVCDDGILM